MSLIEKPFGDLNQGEKYSIYLFTNHLKLNHYDFYGINDFVDLLPWIQEVSHSY